MLSKNAHFLLCILEKCSKNDYSLHLVYAYHRHRKKALYSLTQKLRNTAIVLCISKNTLPRPLVPLLFNIYKETESVLLNCWPFKLFADILVRS